VSHHQPGPRSKAVFDRDQAFMAPGLQQIALFSQLAMEKGEGAELVDVDGRRYIDFFAGVGVASVGHAHPHYVARMRDQLERVIVGSFASENRARFVELLASVTPGNLKRIQLYSGGAEAVEAAMRLAKSATKKFEFVGFWGGFHGKTGGVLGLLGGDARKDLGPFLPGQVLAPYAYCYRCPLKLAFPSCGLACVEQVREVIKYQTGGAVAGILIEPMQGTAGNVIPPPGYLQAIQQVARECGALLIADEMITGLGRTGKMWGVDHDGVVPDVMTVGKGVGAGYPLSLVVTRDELSRAEPWGKPSGSSSSFGGNPLAATAGLASLEVILKEGLVENSARIGARILRGLERLKEKYAFIGDVRGKGLMIGLELVKDRATQEPLGKKTARSIFERALARGLLTMGYGPVMRINPPLVITEAQADRGVAILDEVFAEIAKEGWAA
jgi:4-aminobutyrate aminotransferase-like enzyme